MSETASPTAAEPFEELKVPGEPGVWFCARHRKVQTRLRCGRCEKPICPKCTTFAPTGARCADCASNKTSHIYQVNPRQYALSFLASILVGVAGVFASSLVGAFWIWVLLYAPIVGPLWARVIQRVTGGKKGKMLGAAVALGIVTGGALTIAITGAFLYFPAWIFVAIAAGGAWASVR